MSWFLKEANKKGETLSDSYLRYLLIMGTWGRGELGLVSYSVDMRNYGICVRNGGVLGAIVCA